MDNNLVEIAINPFVMQTKSSLFSNSVAGAKVESNLHTLTKTANATSIERRQHPNHVFTELPNATTLNEFESLLPFNINNNELQTTE